MDKVGQYATSLATSLVRNEKVGRSGGADAAGFTSDRHQESIAALTPVISEVLSTLPEIEVLEKAAEGSPEQTAALDAITRAVTDRLTAADAEVSREQAAALTDEGTQAIMKEALSTQA